MDIFRRLASDAPPMTTFRDSKPTLLVSWWCTCYAIAIITVRFCGRWIRAEKVFLEDGIIVLAIVPLLIRMGFVHLVLIDGTNNTVTDGLSDLDIQQRERGSQLVLAARVFYPAYLWAIKYSTSMFLHSLTESVWQNSHRRYLRYLHVFLLATFLVTIIADLGACQPFSHYWQVVPDPEPKCRQGTAHLYTMGLLNILSNLALIVFPLPMVLRAKVSRNQKASIMARLALPLLSVGFTLYQLGHLQRLHYAQTPRSLLASLDILLQTFISNSIVLLSLLSDKGYKKEKGYKRNASILAFDLKSRGRSAGSRWGSDEDLMIRFGEGEGGKGGKAKGNVMGMKDLGGGEGKEGAVGEGGVRKPDEAKIGDIRVATAWEVTVDEV